MLAYDPKQPYAPQSSDPKHPLVFPSRMGENGVVCSEGIISDYLRFTVGTRAMIRIARAEGRLVVEVPGWANWDTRLETP